VEYPSLNAVMLSKEWSVVGEISLGPFWTDHGVTNEADCRPSYDRLKFDISRVWWVVNVTIITGPDVPMRGLHL
jgi:hypothetical protein